MRAPRIFIAGAFLLTTLVLTILSIRSSYSEQGVTTRNGETPRAGVGALFSLQTPFTLFPPNAIISLTDDNTTSFLARPAAFGPLLPTKGLSGQLWIGSGFGDDSLRQGTVAAGAEGELGCSDVPGWAESSKSGIPSTDGAGDGDSSTSKAAAKSKNQKRGVESSPMMERDALTKAINEGRNLPADDGTDDYLHHPLSGSTAPLNADLQPHTTPGNAKANNHADIQSIQEGAEIAGKVVLLSRGGCGFLEKVKWVQRRGGTALIVGDNQRGGPLIQMYARGDTSNVTIPSVFTSHTTAHLLSSLIPPGSYIEDTIDENGNVAAQVQHSKYPKKSTKPAKVMESLPTFTSTTRTPKPTSSSRSISKSTKTSTTKTPVVVNEKKSWFKSLFGRPNSAMASDSSRPPSSGRLDWVLVNDWNEDDDEAIRSAKSGKKNNQLHPSNSKSSTRLITGDDFVIGVQDWRDPDLVGPSNAKDTGKRDKASKATSVPIQKAGTQATKLPGKEQKTNSMDSGSTGLKGGSITPGSGEYSSTSTGQQSNEGNADVSAEDSGFLAKLFGEDSDESTDLNFIPHTGRPSRTPAAGATGDLYTQMSEVDGHDGLWVTLTPTSSASPFFDTILVLVVSPLVTLTVVYAMLLLRSRIRRRRWRAPKSVVERLPVRTYHTVASSNSSPRAASPISSSPTTPLLSSSSSHPRPRSRTISGVPESSDLVRSAAASTPTEIPRGPSRAPEHEKGASVSSEWKKYMNKQVECVVCLEEYVDGVSQVMSLPCGHEFHVDCITPWLTTRRRTCPICKGDVVRSLARNSSPSSPRYEPFRDDDDDDEEDIQVQAAQTINDADSAHLPLPAISDDDLESGLREEGPRGREGARPSIWHASSWVSSLTGLAGRNREQGESDRSR